jgi:hypothetical protein
MNLNLEHITKIIEKAQNHITEEISKLPKDKQGELNELRSWSKTASLEELQNKLTEYKKDSKDA